MHLEPNDLLLFAYVANERSFSRAAARLGMPQSTLSRRLSALEAKLGERLLLRTTRKLTLTEFGHTVLAHAQQVSRDVEATIALSQNRRSEPSGRLKISMTSEFGTEMLTPLLADFIARHPALDIELDLSPRLVDLIGENFDLAIRVGELPSDASLAARPLGRLAMGLYASPDYVARRGTPADPQALRGHPALRLLQRSREAVPWRLSRGDVQWDDAAPPGRITANSPEMLIRLACAGAGIALLPAHFAAPHCQQGRLTPVLPDWRLPGIEVWAVFPGRRLMPVRTRLFLESLQAAFSSALARGQASRPRPCPPRHPGLERLQRQARQPWARARRLPSVDIPFFSHTP